MAKRAQRVSVTNLERLEVVHQLTAYYQMRDAIDLQINQLSKWLETLNRLEAKENLKP